MRLRAVISYSSDLLSRAIRVPVTMSGHTPENDWDLREDVGEPETAGGEFRSRRGKFRTAHRNGKRSGAAPTVISQILRAERAY